MSYMKTIQKNKERAALPKVVHMGGIDLLIVSPEPGNPEPLFQALRKQQVSGDTAKVYLKFLKDVQGHQVQDAWHGRRLGVVVRPRCGKWHQINQDGVVSHAMPSASCHASACMSRTLHTLTDATSCLLAARNVQAGRVAGR